MMKLCDWATLYSSHFSVKLPSLKIPHLNIPVISVIRLNKVYLERNVLLKIRVKS